MEQIQENFHCENCQSILHGKFCSQCGQPHLEVKVPLKTTMSRMLQEVGRLDSRFLVTFLFLFKSPGALTLEYFTGKRASFVPPFRMFFLLCLIFYFLSSFLLNSIDSKDFVDIIDISGLPQRGFLQNNIEKYNEISNSFFKPYISKAFLNEEAFYLKISRNTSYLSILFLPVLAFLFDLFMNDTKEKKKYFIEHLVFSSNICSFMISLLIVYKIILFFDFGFINHIFLLFIFLFFIITYVKSVNIYYGINNFKNAVLVLILFCTIVSYFYGAFYVLNLYLF